MNLLNSDVSTFRRSSPTKSLPAHTVKKILTHTLEGLIQLHELNIIHTGVPWLTMPSPTVTGPYLLDLKLDNILFSRGGSDKDVDSELKSNPAIADSELEIEGKKYPLFRSQPLPHGHAWDASPSQVEVMQFTIIDLGQGEHTRRLIRETRLRQTCAPQPSVQGHSRPWTSSRPTLFARLS